MSPHNEKAVGIISLGVHSYAHDSILGEVLSGSEEIEAALQDGSRERSVQAKLAMEFLFQHCSNGVQKEIPLEGRGLFAASTDSSDEGFDSRIFSLIQRCSILPACESLRQTICERIQVVVP